MASADVYHLLNAARNGYRLFPVDRTTRKALVENPMAAASSDPTQISAWYDAFPGADWGYVSPQFTVSASAFEWIDGATIPKREWLYGGHHIRRYLSATFATGGVGKSSLTVAEALAMVSGKPLLGVTPTARLRVWLWNGEDPFDELQRKVMAAAEHYGLNAGDLAGLFVDSGRQMRLQIATQFNGRIEIATPLVDAVIATLRENRVDLLVVDPFVTTHALNENDNGAIQEVIAQFARIAEEANCAIDLVHHTRKTNGNDVTVEDGRGASALLAAVRSARVLNRMSKADGDKYQVENHKTYVRVDNGKANLMLPSEHADWFHLKSFRLANGDDVGVATHWAPPDPFEELSCADLIKAQDAVSLAGPWRRHHASADWVGIPIAEAIGWDIEAPGTKARVERILKTWIKNGAFEVYTARDHKKREPKEFVRVGASARKS